MNFSKPFFLFLFLSILIFSSCSSDDDTSSNDIPVDNPEEAIIGEWNLTGRTVHGLEICELGTSFSFLEDASFDFDFHEGDDLEECSNILIKGNYEFLADNNLKVNFETFTETSQTVTYEFPNKTTLLISFNENESNVITETYKKQ